MKNALLIITALFLLTGIVYAEEKKEDVKWEVKINITYNAVDREKADEIAKRVMMQNEKACGVEVHLKKIPGNTGDGLTFTIPDTNYIISN